MKLKYIVGLTILCGISIVLLGIYLASNVIIGIGGGLIGSMIAAAITDWKAIFVKNL